MNTSRSNSNNNFQDNDSNGFVIVETELQPMTTRYVNNNNNSDTNDLSTELQTLNINNNTDTTLDGKSDTATTTSGLGIFSSTTSTVTSITPTPVVDFTSKPEVYCGKGGEFAQFLFANKAAAIAFSQEVFTLYQSQALTRTPNVYLRGETDRYGNTQGMQFPEGSAFFRVHRSLYNSIVNRSSLGFTPFNNLQTYETVQIANNNNTSQSTLTCKK